MMISVDLIVRAHFTRTEHALVSAARNSALLVGAKNPTRLRLFSVIRAAP